MESVAGDRILVVDDDDSIRQIVRFCLSDEGYRVREAPNGEAALEVLDSVNPELILLDLRMPVMDGWEFARRYRTLPGPHAPIVAFVAALNAERGMRRPRDRRHPEQAVRPGRPAGRRPRAAAGQRSAQVNT